MRFLLRLLVTFGLSLALGDYAHAYEVTTDENGFRDSYSVENQTPVMEGRVITSITIQDESTLQQERRTDFLRFIVPLSTVFLIFFLKLTIFARRKDQSHIRFP